MMNANVSKKIGAVVLIVIAGAAYWLLSWLAEVFGALNPTVAVGIIAASATVLVSVISVLLSKRLEHQTSIQKEIRERKVPVYEKLIGFIFRVFKGIKENKPITEQEMLDFMMEFTQNIIVWGSDEVIDAFHKFRVASMSGEQANILFIVEDILLAIRKDLGHKNKNLIRGKILSLFVNDIDKYIKAPNMALNSDS